MAQQKGQLARPIFAKIAPHEFLVANLSRPAAAGGAVRPNGRAPDEARAFDVHTGSLSQAHGSAAVRLGRTRVICGVRGEILPVENIPQYRPPPSLTALADDDDSNSAAAEADNRRQLREYDLLVPNLELATGSAPEFLPGGPPSGLAQVLSTRLYALLHSSGLVDAESLKIWQHRQTTKDENEGLEEMEVDEEDDEEGDAGDRSPELRAYWTLYIDLLFLSFDGNPFDAAWAAVVAALRDTRLPHARWDADRNRVVCASPATTPAPPLTLRGLPVATTVLVCVENKKKLQRQSSEAAGAHWVLVDPDRLEEGQCRESATVVVDCTQKARQATVRALSKSGGVFVGPDEMHTLVAAAEKQWTALAKAVGYVP